MKNIFFSVFLASSFLLVGCGSGMSDRTTAVKRAIETREYNVDTKALMTASVGAFQDLGYTIDVLNSDYGLITGSRTQGTQTTEVNDGTVLDDIVAGLFGFDSRSDDIVITPLKLSATITVKEISSNPLISSETYDAVTKFFLNLTQSFATIECILAGSIETTISASFISFSL